MLGIFFWAHFQNCPSALKWSRFKLCEDFVNIDGFKARPDSFTTCHVSPIVSLQLVLCNVNGNAIPQALYCQNGKASTWLATTILH